MTVARVGGVSEASTPEETTTPAPAVPGAGRILAIVLAVALAAALVGIGLLWSSLQGEQDEVRELRADRAAVTEARNAAEVVSVAMGSYDYRSFDKDFGWLRSATTEDFRTTFAGEDGDVAAYLADLKGFITSVKGHADAEVVRSAAQLRDDGRVTVLLFVDQILSNGQEEPSQALTRVELTMEEQDDRWLVDDMTVHNPDTLRR